MISNDLNTRAEVRNKLQEAIRDNDTERFAQTFDDMIRCIEQDIKADYRQAFEDYKTQKDSSILAARGVRQLTSTEREYYQKLSEAMRSSDPHQALSNLDMALPSTTVNAVFDELQTRHPLLSRINFRPSGGALKVLMNTNAYQEAQWGKLCDEIVKELMSGFVEVETTLKKLSAFLPVCKAMLELGPEWLDDYIRQVLYEAISNGLEAGIVTGDGNDKPIGMDRQVGDDVTVTGGQYPQKPLVKVDSLDPATIGKLIALLSVDPSGKPRAVRDLIMVVNPMDYFTTIMPATTLMSPDGSYRNDVMPYPMDIIQSAALKQGEAILGIAYRYLAVAGMSTDGRIEYSDHYRFLEDDRVYLIKTYANGMPMDNNAFLRLDISELKPAVWRVEMVTPAAPSTDATLTSLTIGSVALTPAFAADTVTYTATTTNASNVIKAVPSNAGADVEIKVGTKEVANGAQATWADGANTVTVTVTAQDGKTTKTYTVTVTKGTE